MKRLLVAAALAPLVFAATARAGEITGADKTTHSTSAEGDIKVDSGASVTPPTSTSSGTVAITVNSNNSVTVDGTISVTETTTGGGTNEGIADGPFANGSDRFGILVTGAGTLTADITTAAGATITVIGENSAGIAVDTSLDGSIIDNGTISATGGNANTTDVTYGLFIASGATVTGNVRIGGSISAAGANATGAALNGNIGGSLDIASNIQTIGFRQAQAPAAPSVLAGLRPDQLLIGGPAVSIGGSIAGGVNVEAPTAAAGNVAATSGGSLLSIGSSPALLIGGAQPITIGPGNNTFAVTIGGRVSGQGDYPNVNGIAIQIGGFNPLAVSSGGVAAGGNFSSVTLTGGLDITGSVDATATATTGGGVGRATAIEIGAGASVPIINVSGAVSAFGANSLTPSDPPPGAVTGILIDPGVAPDSTVLINSGAITVGVTGVAGVPGVTVSKGGIVGEATGVLDLGGGLSEIINTGNIIATITPAVANQTPATGQIHAIVVDNSAAFTLVQCTAVNAAGACTPSGNATLSPNIIGGVDFSAGTGNVTFDLWGGNVTGGGIAFGVATGNLFDIENGGLARGALTVADGGAVAINVDNGELFDTSPGNVSVSTLHVGSAGAIIFTGDVAQPNGSVFNVAGNATLDSGATVGLNLVEPVPAAETFTLIQTGPGNLSAGNISSSLVGLLPFLDNGSINATSDSVSITVSPKSPAELGLNTSETAMLPAWIRALPSDPTVAADVLSKQTQSTFIHAYRQFLPDYAGGPFENFVIAQEEVARAIADPPIKLQSDATRGWVQEIGYLNQQSDTSQVNGYKGAGFGFASGLERARGANVIGVTSVFLTTGVQDNTQPDEQALSATAFEVGAYWRYGQGQSGLNAYAAVNGGVVTLGSRRFFIDQPTSNDILAITGQLVTREAKASWLGGIVSANVGVAYQLTAGRFYMQPEAALDYVGLFQSSYQEKGGGPAFNLHIANGASSQADAIADIVLGMNFGQTIVWRPQLTFGYRAVIAGGPASTSARFNGGQSFTLNPQFNNKSGFLARVGVRASGQYADFSVDAGGQFSSANQTYNARAAARFLF
jgi:hypothetical protein